MQKFTVIWGNVGDDCGKRLDHVEAEPNFDSIMDAAFACFLSDLEASGYELNDADRDEYRNNTPYDGYAILDGHVTDSPVASFN